jgi:hypothetical protein
MPTAIPATIRSSLEILRLDRALFGGKEPPTVMEETVRRVVAVLDWVRARWALVGAHAVGALTEPRATVDVDFIVEEAKLRQVLDALERELGKLEVVDMGPALRLQGLDVDLIRSTTHPLFEEALRHTRNLEGWRIPRPEVLIVLKFLAAVSPWRGLAKKTYDLGDLRALYHAVGKGQLDAELMRRLAAQVYPGAETEFDTLIEKIERGEAISI